MRRGSSSLAILWLAAAVAQTPSPEMSSKLSKIPYPPLAEYARVQGDVRIHVDTGEVAVVSGPPLLRATAAESAKAIAALRSFDGDLIYRFVMDGVPASVQVQRRVPKGDAFDRAILRILRLKTFKTLTETECRTVESPPNDLRVLGSAIEILIHGGTPCVQIVG